MGLLEESRNVVAQQGTVTPEQTMQGQLGTILDTESPLLKKARTRGMQAAQQRGLLNTSMGVEAAESAVLDVAAPIAQFDAGQMSDQAKLNQEWMNRFGQSRIQGGIDVGKIQETAEQQRQTAEQTYQQQIGAGGYSVGLIGSQAAVQSKLQEERAAQDLTAQTQSEAFQSAESAAEKEQQTAIQQSDIDARRESLASEIQSRAAMQGEQLTHDATLAEADRILRSELQAQSEAVQQSEAALQRENEIALQTERLAAQQGISIAEMENKLAMQGAQIAADESQYLADISSREGISENELANRLSLSVAEIASRENLSGEQIAHDAAMQEAKNTLETELQVSRIASQEGVSEAELQNRLNIQSADIAANSAEYIARIASAEGISSSEIASRLALNAADISSRELLEGRQITHDAAMQEAKKALETDLQVARIASQEGISAAELENRIAMQASDIAASEAEYTARIASTENISTKEIANRLALSAAEITSREGLAGNQITHEAALAKAKNVLEVDLQIARIASQKGISEAELQNRIDLQASQITATENQYLADIASRENISTADLANRLALNAADITSRELMAGNQITHEAAVAEAKNQLDLDLQKERSASAIEQIGVQLDSDLVKMDADTDNRMALSAADYASKTELSAVEHEQFLESLVTEYGLKGENQEFIDRAANYRAELAAETARLKVEAGLAEAAVKTMTSLEEVQMKQWVEINKMVFDPDDTVNDSAIRQQAIDAFNLEYADRKAFISNAVSELSSWEWSSSTAGTESGDGTDADSTGSDEPVGLLSSAPSVLYPSEVKPLGKLLSTAKNGNDSQFIQQIADGNDAEIFSSQIRLNGDIVNSIPGTTLYKESVGLTQSFLDTVKADNLSFGTVDDLLSTEGVSAVWSYSDKGWVSSVKDTPAFLKSLSGDIEDDRLYILFTDEGRIQVTGSSLKSGSITDAVVGSIEFWKPYLES